jgi:hypothetical protein
VELAHTNLSKVTRVILVHEDAVVVLSTGVTATTWVLAVLADATVSTRDVTPLFPRFVQSSRHDVKIV